MVDVTFVKDGAKKTLPESYEGKMLSEGWEREDGKKATPDLQEQLKQAELARLHARADELGLKYHPNLGIEKLTKLIEEAEAEE